jgi:hypothetical protein
VLFIIYAVWVYHYRRRAILFRDINGYYEDKFGPPVIVVLILIFLISMIIFHLTLGPVISTPTTVTVRDYRVPLSSSFLNNPELTFSGLKDLKSAIQNYIPRFTLEGNFGFQSTESITWFDSRGSCILGRNGYNLRKIMSQTFDGIERNMSTLQYTTVDWATIHKLDTNFKETLFTSTEILHPSHFLYSREITKPYFPDSLSFQNLVRNFDTFFLWNNVPQSSWSTAIEALNTEPMIVFQYSGVKTTFKWDTSSIIASLDVYIWYLPDYTPVWGELSVSLPVHLGQELTEAKYFYDKLKSLTNYLNGTSTRNLLTHIYSLSPTFCI